MQTMTTPIVAPITPNNSLISLSPLVKSLKEHKVLIAHSSAAKFATSSYDTSSIQNESTQLSSFLDVFVIPADALTSTPNVGHGPEAEEDQKDRMNGFAAAEEYGVQYNYNGGFGVSSGDENGVSANEIEYSYGRSTRENLRLRERQKETPNSSMNGNYGLDDVDSSGSVGVDGDRNDEDWSGDEWNISHKKKPTKSTASSGSGASASTGAGTSAGVGTGGTRGRPRKTQPSQSQATDGYPSKPLKTANKRSTRFSSFKHFDNYLDNNYADFNEEDSKKEINENAVDKEYHSSSATSSASESESDLDLPNINSNSHSSSMNNESQIGTMTEPAKKKRKIILSNVKLYTYSNGIRVNDYIDVDNAEYANKYILEEDLYQNLQDTRMHPITTPTSNRGFVKLWRIVVNREMPKEFALHRDRLVSHVLHANQLAASCEKETRKRARRMVYSDKNKNKDVNSKSKKLAKEMQLYWKKYDKDYREQKKKQEKEEIERRKREEELREAKRQQRKLNFLLTQTELYAHFIANKKSPTITSASTETPISTTTISTGLQTTQPEVPSKDTSTASPIPTSEELEYEYDFKDEAEQIPDEESKKFTKQEAISATNKAVMQQLEKTKLFDENIQNIKLQQAEKLQLQHQLLQELEGETSPSETSMDKLAAVMDIEAANQALNVPEGEQNIRKTANIFRGSLKSYQMKGLNWLVNLYEQGINGILADEMGLGKTVQTIAFLAHLAENKDIWGPFLIVTPSSTLHNWQQEFNKFCPSLKSLPYWGTQKERAVIRKYWNPKNLYSKHSPFHVLITSYSIILLDQKYFNRIKWQYMILDEAQALKSSNSARWRTLLKFNCRNRLLLTGTPIQNSMAELWALLHFIMPTLFDSHSEFNEWFSKDIESHALEHTALNQHQLTRLHLILKPFMLRRMKRDVEQEIAPKIEIEIKVDLTPRQKKLYQGIKDKISISELLEKSMHNSNVGSLMNLVMQFRKVCNHPEIFERSDSLSPFQFQSGILCPPAVSGPLPDHPPSYLNTSISVPPPVVPTNPAEDTSPIAPSSPLSPESIPASPSVQMAEDEESESASKVASVTTSSSQIGSTSQWLGRVLVSNHNPISYSIPNLLYQEGLVYGESRIGIQGVYPKIKSSSANTTSSSIDYFGKLLSLDHLFNRFSIWNTSHIHHSIHSHSPKACGPFCFSRFANLSPHELSLLAGNGVDFSPSQSYCDTYVYTQVIQRLSHLGKIIQAARYLYMVSITSDSDSNSNHINTSISGLTASIVCSRQLLNIKAIADAVQSVSSETLRELFQLVSQTPPQLPSVNTIPNFHIINRTQLFNPKVTCAPIEFKCNSLRYSLFQQYMGVNGTSNVGLTNPFPFVKQLFLGISLPSNANTNAADKNTTYQQYLNNKVCMLSEELSGNECISENLRLPHITKSVFESDSAGRTLFKYRSRYKHMNECKVGGIVNYMMSSSMCGCNGSSSVSGYGGYWSIGGSYGIRVPDFAKLLCDCGKLRMLDELLTNLKKEGHRVLVYSQMTKMIDILEDFMWYRKHRYLRLDGSSKLSDRRDMVHDWQTCPEIFVFLLSTKAGGLGINLTAADTVIFYDSDWNPTTDEQAMDRAHRLGQTKQVTVYRLVTRNTVEERILKRAKQKHAIQSIVIAGGQFHAAEKEEVTAKEVVSLLLDDQEVEQNMQKQLQSRAAGKKRGPKPKPKNSNASSKKHKTS